MLIRSGTDSAQLSVSVILQWRRLLASQLLVDLADSVIVNKQKQLPEKSKETTKKGKHSSIGGDAEDSHSEVDLKLMQCAQNQQRVTVVATLATLLV